MHNNRSLIFFIAVLFSVLSTAFCQAQSTDRLPVTKKIRDSIKNEIAIMMLDDQRYRWMIQFGTCDQHEVDSFKKLTEKEKFKRFSEVQKGAAGMGKLQRDSVMYLQGKLDTANFIKITGIIRKYGYPEDEQELFRSCVIITHNVELVDHSFLEMAKREVVEGNLPADEYASLYDNVQQVKKLPKLYYGSDYYNSTTNTFELEVPKDIEATNRARQEIGLKKLKVK